MRSTELPRDLRACSAVVGESSVKRLALGAAMGTPASARSAKATAFAGTRRPTEGRPAVTTSGMHGRLGRTNVKGPGQNSRASFVAAAGHSVTSPRADSADAMCTITGLVDGRPLI